MDLNYKNKKLEKDCESPNKARAKYGDLIGKNLVKMIKKFKAAETLQDIKDLQSNGLHELNGDRKEEFAVKLTANWRLIFTVPTGEKNYKNINVIRIEKIEDYH